MQGGSNKSSKIQDIKNGQIGFHQTKKFMHMKDRTK